MTYSGAPQRRKHGWAVVLALSTGLLAWLVFARWRESGFAWDAFRATIAGLNWGWVAGAAAFGLLTYVGRALRWQVMIRPVAPRSSFLNLLKATAIGFTAVVLLGRPGELVRPYLISVKEGVPFSSQVATWMLERILDLLTILLIFGVAMSRVREDSVGPRIRWVLQAGGSFLWIFGSICVVLLFLFSNFQGFVRNRLRGALELLPPHYLDRAERLLDAFLAGLSATRNFVYLALMIGYTALEWLLIAACYVCLFLAFPETAGFGWTEALVFMGFVSFGSILQIPGVGGGIQLVTIVVLTEIFALRLELATGMALFTWILTFVVIVPPGLLLALHEGLNWRRLGRLSTEEES
jgi:hypothetical protein